ncbi:MAG: hypothetical protein GYB68_14765 [Chloroflexi bacterium]|nr:hypothetical protein [Chloroflexota bacterium]
MNKRLIALIAALIVAAFALALSSASPAQAEATEASDFDQWVDSLPAPGPDPAAPTLRQTEPCGENCFPPPPTGPTPLRLWRADYWPNDYFYGSPTFTDYVTGFPEQPGWEIFEEWQDGGPIDDPFFEEFFGVRYLRHFTLNRFVSGTVTVISDDGFRVFVNDSLLIDEWRLMGGEEITRSVSAGAGEYFVTIYYFEFTGEAQFKFRIDVN